MSTLPTSDKPTMTWAEALAMFAAVLQIEASETTTLQQMLPGGQLLVIDSDLARADIGILTVRNLPLSLDSVAELSVILCEATGIDAPPLIERTSEDLASAQRCATAVHGTIERGRVTIDGLALHVNVLAAVLALVQADVHRQEVLAC